MNAVDQRMSALDFANEVRRYRANLKRRLDGMPAQEARAEIVRLLASEHPFLDRMPVSQLLASCKRVGPSTVKRTFRRAGIPEWATVGRLTERQRRALEEALG